MMSLKYKVYKFLEPYMVLYVSKYTRQCNIPTVMSTADEESDNNGTELKVIIGVAVGGVVLLVIVIITIIVCVRIG